MTKRERHCKADRPDGEAIDVETGAGTIHIDEEGNVHLPTADEDRE